MVQAIAAELEAVRAELGALGTVAPVPVRDGRLLHASPGAQHLRFRCELEIRIPEGTRVRLQAPGAAASGEVVVHDQELEHLECVFREDVGPLAEGHLTFDSSYLLEALARRLEDIAEASGASGAPELEEELGVFPGRGLAFLSGEVPPGDPVPVERPGASAAQRRALSFLAGQEIAYLWGPPGTGKTSTVAQLVQELVRRGERVLLTAHTNTATDTALLKVLEAGPLQPGEAVRVGFASPELASRGVMLEEVVDRHLALEHAAVLPELDALCREVGARVGGDPHLFGGAGWWSRLNAAAEHAAEPSIREDAGLRARLATAMELLSEAAVTVLRRARVVATTLTRLFTSRLLHGFTADTVVVDEASTASLAHAFVAASHASRRAVAAGDFMQLPPIVQSRQGPARQWLGGNVFRSARCDDPGVDHPLRVMLDEQWRMQPGISAVVSEVFYAGRLRDAPAVTARRAAGPVSLLLDTEKLRPRTERPGAGSKRNPAHARLVARLVELAGDQEIAVIAPYRAQVRLLREAIRARSPAALKSGRVEVFTVHRFQGRDKAVVIFDTAEAPGTDAPFLDDAATPEAPNLINVALSRAKERLVVVAHCRHLREALGRESTLVRVCAAMRLQGGLELDAAAAEQAGALERFLGMGR